MRAINNWAVWVLLAILALGGYFRLAKLNSPTMGGDVMVFYQTCQSGARPSELLLHSPKHLGSLPPLWFAAHNWFLQTFQLEVNHRNARLPDAIMGMLAILAAFGTGYASKDRRVGLLAALFVALQPLHIQMSRECYFYAPIVLGCFLGIWAFMRLADRIERRVAPDSGFYGLAFSAFLLLTNVQISSWSFAIVFAAALYFFLLPGAIRRQLPWGHVIALTIGFALIGIPTLLSDWGMRDALSSMLGEAKTYWSNVFGEQESRGFATVWEVSSSYLVGRGGFRSWTSAFLLIASAAAFAIGWKQERKMRVFACFSVLMVGLLALLHSRSFYPAENRHFSSILPIMAVGVSMGLVHLGDSIRIAIRRPALGEGILMGIFMILIAALNSLPAMVSTRLDWTPPWNMVSTWADAHLPPGTIVLCDRWFTPWNEFRMNPSTNVTYTFTVPSEPLKTYTDSRWRETAKEFFAVNPLAAFFEQKVYWERLGPWTWPQTEFANKQEFVDTAALRLDSMGLYYRAWAADFPREWVPVTIYYNTEEDLVARARKDGERLLCLFGSGWEYTKTQDYRDWYVLKESATLTVYNLTATPVAAFLTVVGAATPGSVTVTAYSGANATFPPNQVQSQRLGPIQLAPGRNEIRLGNLTRTQPPAALLVQRISATEN
jgi:hypothetical protein